MERNIKYPLLPAGRHVKQGKLEKVIVAFLAAIRVDKLSMAASTLTRDTIAKQEIITEVKYICEKQGPIRLDPSVFPVHMEL